MMGYDGLERFIVLSYCGLISHEECHQSPFTRCLRVDGIGTWTRTQEFKDRLKRRIGYILTDCADSVIRDDILQARMYVVS